ncbi:hypothetical protein ACSQ67_007979 [Phaseolus vulgaris]
MSSKQVVKLNEEQIAELREIFHTFFDRNNDGSLTQLELTSLLRSNADQLEVLTQSDRNINFLAVSE